MLIPHGAAMDVKNLYRLFNAVAYKLAQVIFAFMLIWPLCHIAMIHLTHISSWRLWGWGMYASPDPRAYSSLRVVIKNQQGSNENNKRDVDQLFNQLTSITTNPTEESLCINLYEENSSKSLIRLPTTGLCHNQETEDALNYFLHLGSINHGIRFFMEALRLVGQSNAHAYMFLTKQRINMFQNEAFLESHVYSISPHHAAFLGSIKKEGDTHDGAYF